MVTTLRSVTRTAPRQWGVGRLGPLFVSAWLLFLADPLSEGWSRRDEREGWVGLAATVAFAVLYLTVLIRGRATRSGVTVALPPAQTLAYLGGLVVLAAVVMGTLGEPGTACLVCLGAAVVVVARSRVAVPLAALLLVVTLALGPVNDWGSQADTAFGLLAASIAVLAVRSMLSRTDELVATQQENADLAVENERTRFSRDLHDILGHSLTVITVKAELAQRLMDVDADRARAEIADLERLSRDAMADVRRAVQGYREMTLPGELARARNALESAEIEAVLPSSTQEVPSELHDLFAWTIREGVTNVIRHSRARRCEVLLTTTSAEVRDDGVGRVAGGTGSGLLGLSERARSANATMVTRELEPGWSLAVIR